MVYKKFVFCVTVPLICAAITACGGSPKSANSANSIDDEAIAEAQRASATRPPDRGDAVGMEFEDKGDDSANRYDRTPPPTATYKPSNKVKQASATP